MTKKAIAHLKKDPKLKALIEKAGKCELKPELGFSPFAALMRAIVYQQLHGKAAATIMGRFEALFPNQTPTPELILELANERARSVGLSQAKWAAITDLAKHALEGKIPERSQLETMSDQDIVDALTQVRGIGRWTVEMMLIFRLGRLDVWPVTDFGVQKGFQLTYKRRQMPKPKVLELFGERYRPFRSVAAWYFWRATDLQKTQKEKPKSKKRPTK